MKVTLILALGFLFLSPETTTSHSAIVLEEGADLYKQYCKACHGKRADRDTKKIPSLVASELSRDEKVQMVLAGKNTMPPFEGQLEDTQITAILDFIDSLPNE